MCRVCVFRHFATATSKWYDFIIKGTLVSHTLYRNNFEYLYHFIIIIFISWQSIQSFYLLNLDYNYGKYARFALYHIHEMILTLYFFIVLFYFEYI